MAYLIGTDEAGYGPNLGPLVIGMSVWHVPRGRQDIDLYRALSDVVVDRPTLQPDRLAIADSKQLYRPGSDLSQLERSLLCLLAALGTTPSTWGQLCSEVGAADLVNSSRMPWHGDFEISLPTSESSHVPGSTLSHWRDSCEACGVRLIGLQATIIEPAEFNAGIKRFDSKGALLSNRSLDLVAGAVNRLSDEPVRIVCDKHGGRNKYGHLLQPRFGDRLVRVVREGQRASVYQMGTEARPIEISFQVGGESYLPSALASMLAKYLRELSMRAFNAFWCAQLPGLRPTAGYPVDARRFWKQIRPILERLEIDDDRLWRQR